jgi:hypothetical protein
LIDPSGADNADDSSGDREFGNQIAAFSGHIDLPMIPARVYGTYAGEDTYGHSNLRLGVPGRLAGFYLPLRPVTVLYERSSRRDRWYVHHIYAAGYRNDGFSMGHWVGDLVGDGDGIGGITHTVRLAGPNGRTG